MPSRSPTAACLGTLLVLACAAGPLRAQAAPGEVVTRHDAASFEGLAALDRALVGVEGLTDAERDSLAGIERAFRPRFRRNGEALLALFARARGDGVSPDVDAVRALDTARRALWLDELRAARAVLDDARQRARFDANVTAMLGGGESADPSRGARIGPAPRRRIAPAIAPRFA